MFSHEALVGVSSRGNGRRVNQFCTGVNGGVVVRDGFFSAKCDLLDHTLELRNFNNSWRRLRSSHIRLFSSAQRTMASSCGLR
jgi:hypothetical protein